MPANTTPIWAKIGDVQWNTTAVGLVANTAKDGTGTVVTVYTTPVDGGFVEKIRIVPLGTNVATVMRVFLNDGLGVSAANNTTIGNVSLPASTISEVVAQPEYELQVGYLLKSGYKINVVVGTLTAAGFSVATIARAY